MGVGVAEKVGGVTANTSTDIEANEPEVSPEPESRPIVGINPRRTLIGGPGLSYLSLGNAPKSGVVTQGSRGALGTVPANSADRAPNLPGNKRTLNDHRAFTKEEKATIASIFDGKHDISHEELDTVTSILNTPEKASAFVDAYFTWVDTHPDSYTYAPLTQLRDRLGVCRDQHSFVAYVLNANNIPTVVRAYNIRAEVRAYNAPGDVVHAVAVYQRPDGKWAVIDYGKIHGPSDAAVAANAKGWDTPEEAIMSVEPNAWRIRDYLVSSDPTVRPVDPVRTHESNAAIQARRMFNGQPDHGYGSMARLHQPGRPDFGWGANVRADTKSTTMQLDYGALSIEGRKWHDPDPVLKDAAAVRADLRIAEGLTLSGGTLRLPNTSTYDAGFRIRRAVPETVYFVGAEAQLRPLDFEAGKNGWFYVRDDVRVDFNHAWAVADNAVKGDENGRYDVGTSNALSYLDVYNRVEVGARPNDQWSLSASSSLFIPTRDINNRLGSGALSPSTLPVTVTADVNARYQGARAGAEANLYVPVNVRTNLFPDQAHVTVSGYAQVTSKVKVAASADAGLGKKPVTGADAGVRVGPLGVSAGGYHDGTKIVPRGAVSLDVVELADMVGVF